MITRFLLVCLAIVPMACSMSVRDAQHSPVQYPPTARIDQVDNYHGVDVTDPYRWLERDIRESSEVKRWVNRQNAVTFAYLESIPERQQIKDRLTELWDFERYGTPTKEGGRYFFSYNNGLQNQDVVYVQSSLQADAELILDPNEWSDDGTVALAAYYPSPDGKHLAYLVQDGGTDWRTARVVDIENKTTLEDRLEWLKFTSLSWARDGSGFYYSRYPKTDDADKFQSLNMNQAVYFHRLGASQQQDSLAYATPENPDWGHFPIVTDDGAFLVITTWKGTGDRYQITYQKLDDPNAAPTTLIEGFEHDYRLIGNIGTRLWFRTNNDAPRNRLIAIDTDNAAPNNWTEVIPETDNVLDGIELVGGKIIGSYIEDAKTVVKIFDLGGAEIDTLDLPGIGTASGFEGKIDNPETFFVFTSFDTPSTINRLDVQTGEVTLFRKPDVDFNSDDYLVRQVFYASKDGTRIPMFIAHRKDVSLDGTNPALLFGYGGFNISLTPSFSITRLAWMEMGGVYAVANLRGGGEYGKQWYEAGKRLNKQNVFDDFIAAAEYLVSAGYTTSSKLAILGGSNGGLLVGAVTNQRPDLFGAVLPAVGVMDMLRFDEFTAGRFWVDEYGSSENPEEFRALYAYSPYHNVQPGTQYPPTLVTTADTDDRVVPGHSFKYAAAMQAAQSGDAPVLIRVEARAGHGAGKPTEKIIEEYADRWAFLVKNLDMRLPDRPGN